MTNLSSLNPRGSTKSEYSCEGELEHDKATDQQPSLQFQTLALLKLSTLEDACRD